MMKKLSIAFGFLGILLTALPFIQTNAWWIRVLDFPRLQIAIFCLVAIFLLFSYLDLRKYFNKILILLVTGSFLYQCSLVIKFTPLFPVEVQASKIEYKEKGIRILHSNVKMRNRKADLLLELIDRFQPDILSLNEPDAWWDKQLVPLDKLYPFTIKKPLPNAYGMILYSKFPLKTTEINFLVEDSVPSFYTKVILPSGKVFNLHSIHPKPPKPGSLTYERDTELFIVGKRIKKEGEPTIVVGDLNDVAWSRTTKKFKEYSGVLDPRKGRGLYNTFNVNWPLLKYPLDHFFFTTHFQLISMKKLGDIGSDHFPMFTEVSLPE